MILRLALTGILALGAAHAHAVTITFDETAYPTNAINGFGGFTFGGLGGSAVTSGPTSLTIDASSFGGVGVDFVLESPPASGMFVPQDFDPNTHQWELRVKLLPGNTATGLNAVVVDVDGPGFAEEYQFSFDLTGQPIGEFFTLNQPLTNPGPVFRQPAFGQLDGDSIQNYGLRQIQIQTQFASTDRLHVEVDYLRIAEIPEPTAIVLGIAAAAACMTRRVN